MTKAELVNAICKRHQNLSKRACDEMLDTIFDTLSKGLKKDRRFTYPGFGTWSVKQRASRKGVNPRTGHPITIKAYKTVTFKPAADYKKTLN